MESLGEILFGIAASGFSGAITNGAIQSKNHNPFNSNYYSGYNQFAVRVTLFALFY
jgi:hypothetical protein